MSLPNFTNSIIQSQNIVINQVPLSHAIMTNVNTTNGIPLATALAHPTTAVEQNEIKTGLVMETIPIANSNMVGVQNVQTSNATNTKTFQNTISSSTTDSIQVQVIYITINSKL